MNLSNKKFISRFLILILISGMSLHLMAQTSSDKPESLSIDDGIYENKKHFYIVQEDESVSTVLKSFYGFWYDGIYGMEPSILTCPLVQMGDGLYLEWWQNVPIEENDVTGGVFWAPGSNVRELAISPYPVKDKLTGLFVLESDDTEDLYYEIPYWEASVDYADELASFELPDGNLAYVKKFLQIGDVVYTCAAGRRKVVRNPASKDSLPGEPLYSEDGIVMVFDEPYLVRSEVTDMQAEVDAHNALRYPPHFAFVDMTEPSVYRKLDEMSVEMIISTLKF